jgi:glycosyltransferase involved in cell wall biosynthesis
VPVDFSIYGPHEDRAYLERCRALAASLPGHITVFWRGAIPPEQVAGVLARQDLFLFPTRGENYGHVIAEALSVGTPVLIADTTPWRDLASAGVGWDLPLGDESAFVDRIEYCAGIAPTEYAVWRERVRRYAGRRLAVESIIEANRQLFLCAVGRVAVSARE